MSDKPPAKKPQRTEQGWAREARRARSVPKKSGASHQDGEGGECSTGHPAIFNVRPALELGRMPEGDGYPVGFVEEAARMMGCQDLGSIVHLCAGSVRAPFTFDLRCEGDVRPAVRADVRWLPIRNGSVRWILADPPYGQDYAEEIWGLGKVYPTPIVLLRECAAALAPGGRVGLLHHVVPTMPDGLRRVATYGVITGENYRIRAFTIAERTGQLTLPS